MNKSTKAFAFGVVVGIAAYHVYVTSASATTAK